MSQNDVTKNTTRTDEEIPSASKPKKYRRVASDF